MAFFSVMVLALRSAETVNLSSIAVVSLLVFYMALTPWMVRQGKMHSDTDLEAVVTALSSRVLVIVAAGLGVQFLFFGFPRGGFVATIVLGFVKSFSWYFTLRTVRHPHIRMIQSPDYLV